MRQTVACALFLCFGLLIGQAVDAGQDVPPRAPAQAAPDSGDRPTIRATRLKSPLTIDGRLDEAVYTTVNPFDQFIQQEPHQGEPATERTEVWLSFDNVNVYVSVRCWESQPERMVVNEMRRDNLNAFQNENVTIAIDTFFDHRNSVIFLFNPIGGRMDGQASGEREYIGDWNPVYDFALGRFEGGWTVEVAIPFKSLKYRATREQVWGFLLRRVNRWKNEASYNVPVPAARGNQGIFQASLAAALLGIEAPTNLKHLDVKPYVASSATGTRTTAPRLRNDLAPNIGADLRYGLTDSLTVDLTYRTDFAQVEADEQQVNLTRFSLFFPEKREFFLENLGLYSFGGAAATGGRAGLEDTPLLFYSRRIGLDRGVIVPLMAGGRLGGRVGRFSLGLLNVQTEKAPDGASAATNMSVVRVSRDVRRNSSVGVLYTGRTALDDRSKSNEALGVDGLFAFLDNDLLVRTYWAMTRTGGRSEDATSYRGHVEYATDRYGLRAERLVVGPNFDPGIGFVKRPDMQRGFAELRFSPRPTSIKAIRKFSYSSALTHIQDTRGRLVSRNLHGTYEIQMSNSDLLSVRYDRSYEFLSRPFAIAPNVVLPVGGYTFGNLEGAYLFGQQRRMNGRVTVQRGGFYDGRKASVTVAAARVALLPQFSVEPTYSINQVRLIAGAFTTHLAGSRLIYTATPRMLTSALVQYNSSTRSLASNVRLRWEYRPGSELFVVYNEARDLIASQVPALSGRSLTVKINRLLRF